jgi:hypothetical protein
MPVKYMKNKSIYCLFFLLPVLLAETKPVFAQEKPHDSSFYTTYPKKITTRFYFSKKFNNITVPGSTDAHSFEYRPNTQLTTGVGLTLNTLSLNVAYGFGFMNNDDEKGKTKIIDLEGHAYPYKWAVDLLAIRYKGLHIDPKGYATNNENYYYREDAIQLLLGIAAYRVVNYKRFSYNAAMIQSEWQKRSAGSFLYGGEMYYGYLKGDSSLIPAVMAHDFNQAGIDKTQFFTIGVGAGYAYTLVLAKHFYAMGSLITNLDLHFTMDHYGRDELKKNALQPSLIYKAAIGYNFNDWNISANFAGNTLWVKTPSVDQVYKYPIGNYRFIVAKRISANRK